MWVFAVSSEMTSWVLMKLQLRPFASSSSTSVSRGDSPLISASFLSERLNRGAGPSWPSGSNMLHPDSGKGLSKANSDTSRITNTEHAATTAIV